MDTNEIILPDQPEVIEIRLSPTKTPVAFKNKVDELMTECGLTQEEAEKEVLSMTFLLELCYEKNCGLFGFDNEVIDCSRVWSPYTQKVVTFKN